jgi:lysine-specific demethylase 3
MNLAARFPEDLVTPDLGPKMYIAHASSDARNGQGTTKLHLDITDAVNIMTFAAESKTAKERGGAAVWDIFPADATDKLRTFLRTTSSKPVDDPVLRQTFYISIPQLEQLRNEYGIVPWRIYQNPGDAVFIPAGCAHQVCNLTSCIKVACDFVSPHCIRRCKDLIDGNRGLAGIKGGKKEDVLQLKTLMMCAWEEMSRRQATHSDGKDNPPEER